MTLGVNKRMGGNLSNQGKAEIKSRCGTHNEGPHFIIRAKFGTWAQKGDAGQEATVKWALCVHVCARGGGF